MIALRPAPRGVSFLTDDEKRAAIGYGALLVAPGDSPSSSRPPVALKYAPDQPRVPSGNMDGGQWTDGGGGGSGTDVFAGEDGDER